MEKAKKKWYKKWWIWAIIVLIIISAMVSPEDNNEVVANTQPPVVAEEAISFELIAGEPGEYGELFTINKDTEFEETYYIYHIPDGTYTVTNSGDYMAQFNVYSDEIHVTDEGWEEPAEIHYAKALNVGESDAFSIEDGQYIEIHEPAHFILEKTK